LGFIGLQALTPLVRRLAAEPSGPPCQWRGHPSGRQAVSDPHDSPHPLRARPAPLRVTAVPASPPTTVPWARAGLPPGTTGPVGARPRPSRKGTRQAPAPSGEWGV